MDFSKTVIYHFVCKDEMVKCSYVGSTTNFNKRKCQHKTVSQNKNSKDHHLKLYQTIRDNGGWDNWIMKPLEEFACENKIQQVIREQYWIDNLKPEMNCKVAYQPLEIVERMKVYYENNSVHIKEQRKVKYTCVCGSTCCINAKARHERSKKHLDFKT